MTDKLREALKQACFECDVPSSYLPKILDAFDRHRAALPAATAEPRLGLLMSIAIRLDHGLSVPGYYDQPMMSAASGVTHAQRLQLALTDARRVYEEVSGQGFYRPELEAEYAALAA